MDASFVNNFWGKDETKSSQTLFHRMDQGTETCKQLINFYKSKIDIEREYANKLKQLSETHENQLGSSENGTIKTALDVLREQFGSIGECHLNEAMCIETEILKPLTDFQNFFISESSQIEKITKQLLSSKKKLFKEIEVCKMEYYNNCMQAYKHYSSTMKNNSRIAQHDIDKRKDLEKKIAISKQKYETTTERYKQVSDEWVNQWQVTANNLQDLEIERINNLKTNSWNLINLISMTCVKDDTCCEKARVALENCDSISDIQEFVTKFKTGSEIYEAPEVIDFGESQSNKPIKQHEPILDSLKEEEHRYVNANFDSSFNSRIPSLITPKLRQKPEITADSAAAISLEKPLLNFKLDEKNLNENYNNNMSLEKDLDDISTVAPLKFNNTMKRNTSNGKHLLESSNIITDYNKQTDKVTETENNFQTIEIKSPFGTITTTSPVRRSHRKSSPSTGASTGGPFSNIQSSPTTSHSSGPFSSSSENGFSSASSNSNEDAFKNSAGSSNSKWTPGSYSQSKNFSDNNMKNEQYHKQKSQEPTTIEPRNKEPNNEETEIQTMRLKLKSYEDELKMRKIQNEMLLQRQNQEKQLRELKQKEFEEELLIKKAQEDKLRQQDNETKHIQPIPSRQVQQNNKVNPRTDSNKNFPRPKSMIEVAKLSNPKAFESLENEYNPPPHSRNSQPTDNIPLASNGLPLYSSDGKPVLKYAKAKYDYKADAPGEISFKRKDIMLVLEMQEDGWWLVELFFSRLNKTERFGFVPSNYLVPA